LIRHITNTAGDTVMKNHARCPNCNAPLHGGSPRINFQEREPPAHPLFTHVDTFYAYADAITGIAWDPKGQFLAWASLVERKSLWLWDLPAHKEKDLPVGRGWTWSLAFSHAGTAFAAGGPSEVLVWDTTTWTERNALRAGIWPQSLSFSHDDRLLAAGLGPEGEWKVKVWHLPAGQETVQLDGGFAAFSPTQNLLAVTWGSDLQLLNTATWQVIQKLVGHEELFHYQGRDYPVALHSLAFSPNGTQLITGSVNKVCIWDVATAEVIHELRDEGRIKALTFSPDGKLLAFNGDSETAARIFDLESARELMPLEPKNGRVTSLAFGRTQAGTMLALGTIEGALELWALKDYRTLRPYPD
jgi:WD40 repeat protein